MVWRNNLTYGFITPNGSQPVPFNELFLLGGANTLRGYNWYSIGRRKQSTKVLDEAISAQDPNAVNTSMLPYGGQQEAYYNWNSNFR